MTDKARVLIVDNAVDTVLSLQYALRAFPDFEVCTVFNGQQALRLLARTSFDVLITDYHIPGTDGLTLAAHVYLLYPYTHTIMVSSDADAIPHRQVARASVRHVLDRPVEPAQIRRLILDVVEQANSIGTQAH